MAVSSAYGGASAAILEDGVALAEGRIGEKHGLAAALPGLIDGLLARAGRMLDLVAVVVGPGSFTGLRAGISTATGIALGFGIPIVGVTVAEALAAEVQGLEGRVLWTAIVARRGRLFLDTGHGASGIAETDLPDARGRIAVCGNAANWVAASLAARGTDVMLTAARTALPAHVAAIGRQRAAGELPPLAALPLYVDAPEARPQTAGMRTART